MRNSDECDGLVPEWPAPAGVHAACTTRCGGVSLPPYDSLNLGLHVGDARDAVLNNRAQLVRQLGVRLVFLNQVHGLNVMELNPGTPDGLAADGAVTRMRGVACTVMVADCLPILLCDAQGQRVAALHAGWRGLAGEDGVGIVEQGLDRFMRLAPDESRVDATNVIAWLGPCIGPQAFEVGNDVRSAFVGAYAPAQACFAPGAPGKWFADLQGLARQRLQRLGVTRVYGNDGTDTWCTVSQRSRFFSHRRDGVSGRMAASIWLA